jgi:glycosyltransferase involved in cell wall biosynthesis
VRVVTKPERVALVIPAFNESQSITTVVNGISALGTAIVVDDGSIDNTGNLARAAGAFVISHQVNRGYDAALSSGLAAALTEGFDFAITFDGDGQHDPALIQKFLTQLLDGADIVVGIRERFQRPSEALFAFLAKVLWGILDPLCGMKGYRLSKLKGVGNLCSYPSIGTELTIRAARSGWRIQQISITTNIRKDKSRFGEGFHANRVIIYSMLLGLVKAKAHISDNH